MSAPRSQELLDQWLAGKPEAAAAIFDRYVERLLALARTRLGAKLRRRVDPDDIVQSAYRSFFLHAREGEFHLDRSGDLWRLLAGTTLNKLYGEIERQTAAKRSVDRETTEDSMLTEVAAREPTVAEVVAVAEQLTGILKRLSADERLVLTSNLQGQDLGQIARALGKSQRTVRRLLAQAKQQFEKQLLVGNARETLRRSATRRRSVEPHAPLRFEDYVLEKLIGAGGMGKVYRATEKRTGTTCAIKSLHKAWQQDVRAVDRFVQESQLLGQLRHPNLVGVKGLGRFPGGGYFLVMDFVDGADLETRLKSGPLAVAEAVSIVRQVASAVQHAHDHGIVHCDLKPANVLLGSDSRAVVTDFGFAYVLAERSAARLQGLGGTAAYLAPEILNLQSSPAPASDVYALGKMLWTLVTGRVPSSRDELQAHSPDGEPLAALCRHCLADDPAKRFSSASELLNALNTLQIAQNS